MSSRIFRVKGPPGTGKTTFLARQARLAAEKHGDHGVAIASLTKTAAAEIGGRDTPLPAENIGTLHAHCFRALECERGDMAETTASMREFADNGGVTAQQGLLNPSKHSGSDDDLSSASNGSPLEDAIAAGAVTQGGTLHSAVVNHRARRDPVETWTVDEREYAKTWEDFKQHTGRLDFTDLIEHCLRDEIAHPTAPRVLLLDEAQDFSALELALAVHWSRSTETTVIVGDTDQALYGWRGSDAGILDSLQVAGDRVLEESFRVPAAVHAAANQWISQIDGRRHADWKPTDIDGQVGQHPWSLHNTTELVDTVRADLAAGRTSMVLTSCTYMLAGTIAALRDAGIPFHNPHRTANGSWNPMRGAGRLAAFLRPREDVWGEQARNWTWDDLHAWTDPLTAAGTLARGAKTAIEEHCREGRFGEDRGSQEVPLETLCTLLGDQGNLTHPAFRLDVDWWEARLRAKTRKPAEFPLAVLRAQGGKALIETPKVTIGTIHSVKGGEADSVHLAPDLSRAGYWQGWHQPGPGRDAIVRMFYVGLTRARQQATVLQPIAAEHVDPAELVAGAQLRAAA